MLIFDDWQNEIINCTEKRILLCKGRQIGGTTTFARKAAKRLLEKSGTNIIVVSITEDQAQLVIVMVLRFLEEINKNMISRKKTDLTKSQIKLKNNSVIISRPVGSTGNAIRGFTGGILWLNEASRIPEFAIEAAKPVLLTTDGEIWMDSTPFGKQGYFWECFNNKSGIWKVFYKSSEQAINERKISSFWTLEKRDGAIRMLKEEKEEMTELQYGQEYLGLFLEDLRRFFSDEWISKMCTIKRDGIIRGKTYFGADIAGMGEDKNSFDSVDKIDKDKIRQIEHLITKKEYTTQTTNKILDFYDKFHFKKMGIDDMGVGFGVFSELLATSRTKDKVVALNNSRRALDSEDKSKKRLIKEDMYITTLVAGEKGNLKLLDDEDIKLSLASVQIDTKDGKTTIFGKDTHAAEGIVRAVYLAVQDKTLNLWAA
ncbi:MAG: terminase family protein [Clostridia bacterium]|nr:terminase family protein [Clostridia bacterium]